MKVFFVNTNQAWGGGEKWHFETASMLKRHGHNVAILTGIKTQLFKQSDDAGIKTIPVIIGNLSFLNPFRVHKLKQLFKSEKPDILILNLSADLKTAGIAAVLADIKHIIYRRGNAKPVKNSATNRILFRKIVTGIIANSEETKRSLLKNNSELFPADCIKVLYNGIDLKQFYNQEYTPLIEKKKGTVILGSAGRLSNEKGQQYLIELAILLKKQKLEFKLLIAGDGSMKESLLEKCR
ncbi:glycosyltransferase, partial [bacterium]